MRMKSRKKLKFQKSTYLGRRREDKRQRTKKGCREPIIASSAVLSQKEAELADPVGSLFLPSHHPQVKHCYRQQKDQNQVLIFKIN